MNFHAAHRFCCPVCFGYMGGRKSARVDTSGRKPLCGPPL